MRSVMRMSRVACLVFLGGLVASQAQAQDTTAPTTTAPATTAPVVVDATMEAMRSSAHTLSAERGHRVVVLFYEDRDHIEDNAAFKGDLERFIVDNHLEERAVTYGVANLADVGMVPHAFVRQMITPLLDRFRSDILLDWDGVMRRAPFSFPTAASTCALIDRTGAIVYRYTGTIDETQRRAFYAALRRALAH
jgi:hypothetical protein